jgi:ATP-dependent Lhr-like helicase
MKARFHPAVEEWFAATFPSPTLAQEKGWPPIQGGRHTLVFAPTGSGKTLAAFLAAIDRLMFAPVPDKRDRCRVLYVSPLRALAVDVERNLRAPIAGIARAAERRHEDIHVPVVGLRTGDTPADERARMVRQPPDILITTPESLFLVLTSQARAMLTAVEAVIVDEIHTMVGSKRGAHLALSLERLQELARTPPQRIGLSATQRPLEEVARYLGGGEPGARAWRPRPVEIVDAGSRKALSLTVEVPVEDMTRPGRPAKDDGIVEGPAAAAAPHPSIWPAIHPRLLELIRAHRSTLVFVNSRRLAERMAAALNELAGEELVRAHHGSLSREQRLQVEDDLKAGRLPAMVATSSLELGIDMGAIDLVIQIEAPPSVASGLQRIGRGGHQAGAVSRGVIFPKYRGDLLAAATITRAMHEGKVEETRVPMNPLDVLAQQVVAVCAVGEQTVDGLFTLVRRAAPFARLPRAQLEGVLDMLSGRYPSDEFAELRPRLVWDRLRGTVRAREGAARLAVTNAGTIPDRGLYGVFLADGEAGGPPGTVDGRRPGGRRVGELDEEMVFESRAGEVFVLGASSWRIVEIERDRVLVVPAPGEPGRMPFWKGDRPARPVELGRALGRLTRELAASPRAEALRRLVEEHDLDARAAENLITYIAEQKEATGVLPDDRTLVLERTRDEMGDWRLCLLSPWGGRVHAPWALALQARLRTSLDVDVETVWSDDGIVVRVPDREQPPTGADLVPDPDEIEDLVVRELGGSALFAAHFREAAARALLLPRRRPGLRSPLWMQRKRAADLLAVAARYGSFPIILETYRECLQDVFDLPALVALASGLRRREIRVMTVDTATPSPFSASLLFGYVANYLYDGDAPLAERKAQALSVDQAQLRELLGQAELRELLDPEAIDELERTLQGLDETHRARSADRLHELLLRIGDLTPDELRARVIAVEADAWISELLRDRRIIQVRLAGDERFAAAEDAGRLRDAFGIPPPAGLPQAFLEPVPHALRDVVSRYARTHAPFASAEVARRFAIGESAIEAALDELVQSGRVVEGAFRPGGGGREWCDAGVLATLRRKSLARLRRQVEPAEPAALARLGLQWQGIVTGPRPSMRRGPDAVLDVVEQIQGAAVPASALETDVLPARIPGYRAEDLDALCAAGEVVWVGLGPLGERDGRITLLLADALPLLHAPRPDAPAGEVHEALRAHLAKHGASFFAELAAAVPGTLGRTVLDALWDLVWAGEVTNDTPGALRAYLRPRSSSAARRGARGALFRSRRQSPPSAVGRWSRLPRPAAGKGASTARAKAIAEQLLSRHGVLTRPAVMAEGVAGGFAALYPVLKALEEAGRIRRGYFVAGLGGSQFALPGALDRLRAVREGSAEDEEGPPAAVLAATDPANPYGAALPWPEPVAGRAMRAAGMHVALVDGVLAAIVARGDGEIVPILPEGEPARTRTARALAACLTRWALRTGRTTLGWGGAGSAADHAALAAALQASGFVSWGPGFRLARTPPPPAPGMSIPSPDLADFEEGPVGDDPELRGTDDPAGD